MGKLTDRLRELADCDARAGEPLGKAMREAADAIDLMSAALKMADGYLLDALNDNREKIKRMAGYDRLVARQEAYGRDIEGDREIIASALASARAALKDAGE